jgi:ferritin-like metal-binding protein YciE
MDRTEYDAPTRSGRLEQQGIAHATIEGETRRFEGDVDSETEAHGRMQRIQDRFGNLQEQFTELLNVRSVGDLEERVRQNPWGAVAFAAGLGFALERTHLIDGMVGGVLGVTGVRSSRELSRGEERLLAWLNDAYALERAQIPILENHAEDARRQPNVRDKDLEHLEQTREHAKLVKECIGLLGAKPGKAKDAIGRITGAVTSLSTEPFDDEVVRNFLADFASENLEIISYEAIIALAEETGNRKIAKICGEILEDEVEMAAWLRRNIRRAVNDTLIDIDILAEERARARN